MTFTIYISEGNLRKVENILDDLEQDKTVEDITQAFIEYVSRELDSGKYERHKKPWYRKERW